MTRTSLANLAFHERVRREVLQRTDLIPSMPEVVVKVLRLSNDRSAGLADFEECLRADAPLVARLLKVVNSPFYGFSRQITSVKDAVSVLGTRGVRSLVLAAGASGYLERNYSCYGHDARGLWKHSVSVAAGAKEIAKALGADGARREELFVAGLLHDIGKMLLGPFLVDLGEDVSRHPGETVEVERQLLGTDHQQAGALVAERWNLSEMVADVVRGHHGGATGPHVEEVAIVGLADRYAQHLGHGYRDEVRRAPVGARQLAMVGLDADRWAAEIAETVAEVMEASVASLGGLGGSA